MVGSFRRLRGFSVCTCSSVSDRLLPRVVDALTTISPGSTRTGSSILMGLATSLEGAWERTGCEGFDKFAVLP